MRSADALLVLALLLSACAHGAEQRGRVGYAAWDCGTGEVYGWVRVDMVDTPDFAAIIAHERDHVRVMREVGGCTRWMAWRIGRVRQIEASAYCASARADAASGRFTWPAALAYWGRAHAWRFRMDEMAARSEVEANCELSP